jgi:hypothetical protein
MPVGAVAISTQSSLASLPAMLTACRKLGISGASAEFALPLCVALFRATGPAMNLAVAIYVAKLTGVTLSPAILVAGAIVAAITEISSPSCPARSALSRRWGRWRWRWGADRAAGAAGGGGHAARHHPHRRQCGDGCGGGRADRSRQAGEEA